MDLNEASDNLKKLRSRLKQTHKNCVNCERRFPFWMTKNHCPYCGSSQVQWVFEREWDGVRYGEMSKIWLPRCRIEETSHHLLYMKQGLFLNLLNIQKVLITRNCGTSFAWYHVNSSWGTIGDIFTLTILLTPWVRTTHPGDFFCGLTNRQYKIPGYFHSAVSVV